MYIDRVERRRLRCRPCGQLCPREHSRVLKQCLVARSVATPKAVAAGLPAMASALRAQCGVRVEAVHWAARWARVTRALAAAVAVLARQLSWQQTALALPLELEERGDRRPTRSGPGARSPAPPAAALDRHRRGQPSQETALFDRGLRPGTTLVAAGGRGPHRADAGGLLAGLGRRRCRTFKLFAWTCGQAMPRMSANMPRRPRCCLTAST